MAPEQTEFIERAVTHAVNTQTQICGTRFSEGERRFDAIETSLANVVQGVGDIKSDVHDIKTFASIVDRHEKLLRGNNGGSNGLIFDVQLLKKDSVSRSKWIVIIVSITLAAVLTPLIAWGFNFISRMNHMYYEQGVEAGIKKAEVGKDVGR